MRRTLARLATLACCAAIIALALTLWSATGRAGYTRYFDPARAQADQRAADASLGDLFEHTGVTAGAAPLEGSPNSFALGLLPGGAPPDKRFVSVATLAAPASASRFCFFAPRVKPDWFSAHSASALVSRSS